MAAMCLLVSAPPWWRGQDGLCYVLWHRGGATAPCRVTPPVMHFGHLVHRLATAGQVALFVQQVGAALGESLGDGALLRRSPRWGHH